MAGGGGDDGPLEIVAQSESADGLAVGDHREGDHVSDRGLGDPGQGGHVVEGAGLGPDPSGHGRVAAQALAQGSALAHRGQAVHQGRVRPGPAQHFGDQGAGDPVVGGKARAVADDYLVQRQPEILQHPVNPEHRRLPGRVQSRPDPDLLEQHLGDGVVGVGEHAGDDLAQGGRLHPAQGGALVWDLRGGAFAGPAADAELARFEKIVEELDGPSGRVLGSDVGPAVRLVRVGDIAAVHQQG